MAIHALIETGTLTDRGDRRDFAGPPIDLSHKSPPLKWVPVTAAGKRPQPSNPETHYVQRADDAITVDDLTESWEEVAYTAQEITDRATAKTNAVNTTLTDLQDEADREVSLGDGNPVRIRALIELMNKRDNYLVQRIIELQDEFAAMKATSGNADNLRAAILSSHRQTATRTKADAIADYKADIAAGNQNT